MDGQRDSYLLGRYGARLSQLSALGLSMAPGFTIGEAARRDHLGGRSTLQPALAHELEVACARLEKLTRSRLGDPRRPLVLTVTPSPGDRQPLPWERVEGVGLTDAILAALARATTPGTAEHYGRRVDVAFLAAASRPRTGSPLEQLCDVVLGLWDAASENEQLPLVVRGRVLPTPRRRWRSGSAFSRDPLTGAATGPAPISPDVIGALGAWGAPRGERDVPPPTVLGRLQEYLSIVETEFRDACRIDFSSDGDTVWIDDAVVAQRSRPAALRMAMSMVDEGLIDADVALRRIPPGALAEPLWPAVEHDDSMGLIAQALPAPSGVIIGDAAFARDGLPTPGTIAIDARPRRQQERSCAVPGLHVEPGGRSARLPNGRLLRVGETVTYDGASGLLAHGCARLVAPSLEPATARLMSWCDDQRAVPVVGSLPPGLRAVTIRPGDESPAERLRAAVLAAGGAPIALELPDALVPELHPPRANWTAIVAPPGMELAARLLAARLPVEPAPPRDESGGRGLGSLHRQAPFETEDQQSDLYG